MSPDDRKFEVVLEELRQLWISFQDLSFHLTLIGGQVLSLLRREKTGSASIEIEFPTGVSVSRGYTFEPDILIDLDGLESRIEEFDEVLRQGGYTRQRGHRWGRTVTVPDLGAVLIEVDFFRPRGAEAEEAYAALTALDADRVLAHSQEIHLEGVPIRIPDALGFISMKLDAKRIHRPAESKDCLDIIAYIQLIGAEQVREALIQSGEDGGDVRRGLEELFGSINSRGVQDVLSHDFSRDRHYRELLAQGVVDLVRKAILP